MATGEIWLRVPDSMRIIVDGEFLAPGLGKDLVLRIMATSRDGGRLSSVEFPGRPSSR